MPLRLTKSMTINEAHFIQRTRESPASSIDHLGQSCEPSREQSGVGRRVFISILCEQKCFNQHFLSSFTSGWCPLRSPGTKSTQTVENYAASGLLHDLHINFNARLFLYARKEALRVYYLPYSSPSSLFFIQRISIAQSHKSVRNVEHVNN